MFAKLTRNAGRLLTNPAMAAAYARWCADRVFGRPTRKSLPGGGTVGGFSTFSAYWSFHPVEGAEFELLRRWTRDAAILGDIGANLGAFSIALARLAPRARVLCFEPIPNTFQLLEQNVRENNLGNVTCFARAVCDEIGTVRFTNQDAGSAINSLVSAGSADPARTVEVPAITLDQFCDEQRISGFDFLKIDAEGAEPRILRGAQQLFRQKRIKAALIEVCSYWLQAGGSNAVELAEQIRSLGYELYSFRDDGSTGAKVTDDELRRTELMNALVLPQ
jgi:FkbM family methyltransferase